MADSPQLKTTYKPKAKLEAFYTGAAARLTRDGKHVVCSCGDEVKVGGAAQPSAASTGVICLAVLQWVAGQKHRVLKTA